MKATDINTLEPLYSKIAFAAAFAVLSLFIGPKYAFHQPASAALNSPSSAQSLTAATQLWRIDAQSPEMKKFEKRPVHRSVYDSKTFATRQAIPLAGHTRMKSAANTHLIAKKRPHRFYHSLIEKIADQHRVDPALIKAMVRAESSYNPKALSPAGAMGLMQLMPATAKELGVSDSYDPEENLHGGIRYYKRLLKRYAGDVELALAAYNAGMGSVELFNGVPPFKETRKYIKRVKTYYDEYKDQVGTNEAGDTSNASPSDSLSLETLRLTNPVLMRV